MGDLNLGSDNNVVVNEIESIENSSCPYYLEDDDGGVCVVDENWGNNSDVYGNEDGGGSPLSENNDCLGGASFVVMRMGVLSWWEKIGKIVMITIRSWKALKIMVKKRKRGSVSRRQKLGVNFFKMYEGFHKGIEDCMLGYYDVGTFRNKWLELVAKFVLEENPWVAALYEKRSMWATTYLRGIDELPKSYVLKRWSKAAKDGLGGTEFETNHSLYAGFSARRAAPNGFYNHISEYKAATISNTMLSEINYLRIGGNAGLTMELLRMWEASAGQW
ncbi:FAR1-related protein [Sesbania bispinosa]|nr:FAR1-related protein [Sesbania bispinosa]